MEVAQDKPPHFLQLDTARQSHQKFDQLENCEEADNEKPRLRIYP